MKEKRYEIIKRAEREALEGRICGINAIGGTDVPLRDLLKNRDRYESPLPRSSPVNEQGVQMQQGTVYSKKAPAKGQKKTTKKD